MEAEKDEAIKSYNNPFGNIKRVVEVAVVVAFLGYWGFPAIMNLLQVVIVWFDWFCLVLRNLFFVFIIVNALIFLIYVSFSKTTGKNKRPDLHDQYVAAVPTVPRTSPFYCYDDFSKIGEVGYTNSNYREIVPAFQAVKAVEESDCTYGREVVEVNPKSYRRTRSEKKTEKKVEYRRTESERVMTWRSQTMDGLSSEEFRMTVETFITEKKKTLLRENDVVDHWQSGVPQWHNGVVNHLQNGVVVPQWQHGAVNHLQNGVVVPQLQHGAVNHLQNGVVVPQLQHGAVNHLQNGVVVPQWQHGAVNQWQNGVPECQNGVVQWQGSRDDGTGRHRHRHRSRSSGHRLVGGSGSNGSGSYLAIAN